MAQTPPAKAPTGPKVSGTRTCVSLVVLAVVLVVSGIELRAGLGQFLTLRAFNNVNVSENNQFKNVPLAEVQGMVAAFPSKSDVKPGQDENVHHYYWYSLLRPLMGQKSPELFVWADQASPPTALSFSTSIDGEYVAPPVDPNASPAMPPGGPGGMGMGGPPGGGRPGGGRPGGGPPGGGPPGGGPPVGGGGGLRPPMDDETTNPAPADAPKTEGEADAAPTDAAPTDAAPTEPDPTTEPAKEDEKSETPATPN